MALRAIEGFESFGVSGTTATTLENAIKAKWGDASTAYSYPDGELLAGWGSGLAFHCRSGGSGVYNYITFAFDDQDTWIVGFAIKTGGADRAAELFRMLKSTNSQCFFGLTQGGQIYFSGGDTFYGTRVLKPNVWYYVECKVYIHDSTGTVDVNINGIADITETGADTKGYASSAYADTVKLNLYHSDGILIDDIYICDGAAGVNAFIGPCKVESIRPDADDTVAWDCSTGVNNYALVAELTPTYTTYVEGDTITESDLYTYGALSTITGGIAGVQLNTGVMLDAAGTRQLDDRLVSGANNSNGPGVAIADTAGEVITRIIEQDPATAANWIVAGIAAVKAGVIVGD